jgi:hypothetical protein
MKKDKTGELFCFADDFVETKNKAHNCKVYFLQTRQACYPFL